MGIESYKLGREGEDIAAAYLRHKGYIILDKNFHSQQGEIDIVARDGDYLVFVEVKNYSFKSLGSPVGAIRKSKRESIVHAARFYLLKMKLRHVRCRFDVVTIYRGNRGEMKMELYKNAFQIN